MNQQHEHHHFLLVAYPIQGHITPVRDLAMRLASLTNTTVTISTAISGHRRMFNNISSPDQEVHDGMLTYIPFSDGYDNGFNYRTGDNKLYMSTFKQYGHNTLSTIVQSLARRGRPVTCIVYTILMSFAAGVAREHNIPWVLFWNQSVTVFAIYYYFFNGHDSLITAHASDPEFIVHLPELPPFKIRELPSFITITDPDHPLFSGLIAVREDFQALDMEAGERKRLPKVLFNSFDALEPGALASVKHIETLTVAPLMSFLFNEDADDHREVSGDLFKNDDEGSNYMEWLDSKKEGSVVYVSFGSMAMMKKAQMEEMMKGLKESDRPYLWVVRKDNREEAGSVDCLDVEGGGDDEEGMVVQWCSQVRVLSHRAVGCFVTHCGWNSMLESLVCGKPMVGVPQWTDQGTNAKLVEEVWGIGVRGEVDEEGVLKGKELKRCLELVMDQEGEQIRSRASMWRDKALDAAVKQEEGGSSYSNLKAFLFACAHDY